MAADIARRDVLRAVGGAALLVWPVLRARAAAPPPPRLVTLYFPNGAPGTPPEVIFPTVDGARWDWTGRVSEPLRPFEDRIAFHPNLRLQRGKGGAHNPAACGFLTGAEIVEGEPRGRNNGDTPRTHSLDVHVARATRTPVLYLAVAPDTSSVNRISWEGDDRALVPEADPARAYEAVFGGFVRMCQGGPPANAVAVGQHAGGQGSARERRVLDLVAGELRRATRLFGLGADERAKLQRYEQALQEIEHRLRDESSRVARLANACARRPAPPPAAVDPPAIARAHADILTAALALNLRQVATLQLFHPYNNQSYAGWLPVGDKPHHAMTHDKGYADRVADARAITRWHMEQFAGVLDRLRSFPDGDADLLANAVVVMGTDVPNAFTHDHKEPMATMIAGGGAGKLRGRTRVEGPMRENVELLATLAAALGTDAAHYRALPGYRGDVAEILR